MLTTHVYDHNLTSITIQVCMLWVLAFVIIFGATLWGKKAIESMALNDLLRLSVLAFVCLIVRLWVDTWIYVAFTCKLDASAYLTRGIGDEVVPKARIILDMILSLLSVISYPARFALASLPLIIIHFKKYKT